MTHHTYSFNAAQKAMSAKTGVIIPVYFPDGIDVEVTGALLTDTVSSYCNQLDDPSGICLSLDGDGIAVETSERLSKHYGVSLYVAAENRGKLYAVLNGFRNLLDSADVAYVAVVDQDGDHFAHELPNFIRAAQHITGRTGDDRVLVLGRRTSRHRPMGFLRGELEELADRILLDALSYHAVVTGNPLRLEYAAMFDEFPDFHSGYKLFSTSLVERILNVPPQLEGVSSDCYYRHSVEAVLTVEALENGGYLGVVNRSTFNDQPVSTFGMLNRVNLIADKIIWPCKRLGVPSPFVEQWLANHIPRLLLNTYAPDGRDELMDIRAMVLAAFGKSSGGDDDLFEPLFL